MDRDTRYAIKTAVQAVLDQYPSDVQEACQLVWEYRQKPHDLMEPAAQLRAAQQTGVDIKTIAKVRSLTGAAARKAIKEAQGHGAQ